MPQSATRETVVLVSNDKAVVASVARAVKDTYIIQFCNDSAAAINQYFACPGAKRCHAIIIDVDPFNGSASCQEHGASLVKRLRLEVEIDVPILVLCFEDLNTHQNKSKYTMLKRRGHYFLRQPYLLPALKKMLLNGRKCDLPHEIKCSRIERYGVFVKHEFIDKLDWKLKQPEDLRQLWVDTRGVYIELGGFENEIVVLSKSIKAMDKMAIILAVNQLLLKGTILSSRG